MKNKTQTQELAIIKNYSHKEAELLIASTVLTLNQQAISDATDMAELSRPQISDTSLTFYVEGITKGYQVLIEKVNSLIGSDSAKADGVAAKDGYKREEQELITDINDVEHELRQTKKALSESQSNLGTTMKNWTFATLGLFILSGGEILFNLNIFSLLTDGDVIKNLIAAFSMVVGLFALPHIIHRLLSFIPKQAGRIAMILVFVVAVLGLLYSMTQMRLGYMNAMGESISDHVSWYHFVVINMFFFLIGLFLVLVYAPEKGQKEAYKQYNQINKKLKNLDIECKAKKERLKIIPSERDEKLSSLYALLLMAKSYEEIIESHHLETIALYIKTNMLKRKPETNGQTPSVFLMERPTLNTHHQNFI